MRGFGRSMDEYFGAFGSPNMLFSSAQARLSKALFRTINYLVPTSVWVSFYFSCLFMTYHFRSH